MTNEHQWAWYPDPNGPRAQYHRKVLTEAIGLNDAQKDFTGRKVLIVGNEPDLLITDELTERGAEVVAIGMQELGDPKIRKAILASSKLAGKYDDVLLAMSPAFYQGNDRKRFLRRTMKAVDFRKGGTWAATALNWETYDEAARTSADVRLTRLTELTERLFEVIKFDRKAGATLDFDAGQAAKSAGIANRVEMTYHEDMRPKGPRTHEVEELARMFITIVENDIFSGVDAGTAKVPGMFRGGVRKQVKNGIAKRVDLAGWKEYQQMTAGIMQKSEDEQLVLKPPSAVTVRIEGKNKRGRVSAESPALILTNEAR